MTSLLSGNRRVTDAGCGTWLPRATGIHPARQHHEYRFKATPACRRVQTAPTTPAKVRPRSSRHSLWLAVHDDPRRRASSPGDRRPDINRTPGTTTTPFPGQRDRSLACAPVQRPRTAQDDSCPCIDHAALQSSRGWATSMRAAWVARIAAHPRSARSRGPQPFQGMGIQLSTVDELGRSRATHQHSIRLDTRRLRFVHAACKPEYSQQTDDVGRYQHPSHGTARGVAEGPHDEPAANDVGQGSQSEACEGSKCRASHRRTLDV